MVFPASPLGMARRIKMVRIKNWKRSQSSSVYYNTNGRLPMFIHIERTEIQGREGKNYNDYIVRIKKGLAGDGKTIGEFHSRANAIKGMYKYMRSH